MIEFLRQKELKSSTSVKGIVVQTDDKKYYKIIKVMLPRNPWFMICNESTASGKSSGNTIFSKKYSGKPSFKEGISLLLDVLNESTAAPDDKPSYGYL